MLVAWQGWQSRLVLQSVQWKLLKIGGSCDCCAADYLLCICQLRSYNGGVPLSLRCSPFCMTQQWIANRWGGCNSAIDAALNQTDGTVESTICMQYQCGDCIVRCQCHNAIGAAINPMYGMVMHRSLQRSNQITNGNGLIMQSSIQAMRRLCDCCGDQLDGCNS